MHPGPGARGISPRVYRASRKVPGLDGYQRWPPTCSKAALAPHIPFLKKHKNNLTPRRRARGGRETPTRGPIGMRQLPSAGPCSLVWSGPITSSSAATTSALRHSPLACPRLDTAPFVMCFVGGRHRPPSSATSHKCTAPCPGHAPLRRRRLPSRVTTLT